RTEPFFPLRSRRSSGLTRPRSAFAIPSSGFAPCARSGITPGPLLRFDKPSHGFCSDNSLVVLFVELHFYNTVVIEALKNSSYTETVDFSSNTWLRTMRIALELRSPLRVILRVRSVVLRSRHANSAPHISVRQRRMPD